MATAAQAAGAGPGRLTPELAEAVSAAGPYWAQQQTVSTRFCECVKETVDDCDLTPEELTRGLEGWSADSGVPRSHWLYGRNRRAFLAEARSKPKAPLYAVPDSTPYVDDPWAVGS